MALADFVHAYLHVPLIVTSRVRPYTALQRTGEALDWSTAALDRLTEGAIEHLGAGASR